MRTMKKMIALVIVLTMVLSSLGMVFAASGDTPSSWANEFVKNAKDRGKLSEDGRLFGNYQNSITRKDFAYLGVMIYEEITGESASVLGEAFTDTSDSYILKARALNIVSGVGNNRYDPNRNITRQELAVLFMNIFKATGVAYDTNKGATFADDSNIESWAKDSVYLARANGLVAGVGNNKYDPQAGATIEQSLIMYMKAVNKFAGAGVDLSGTVDSGEHEQGTLISISDLNKKLNIPNGFSVTSSFATKPFYILAPSYEGEKVGGDISINWEEPNTDNYYVKVGIGFNTEGPWLNKKLVLGVDEQTYNDFYEIPKQPLLNVQGYKREHVEKLFNTAVAGTKKDVLGPLVEGTNIGGIWLVYNTHVIKVVGVPDTGYFYMTIYPINNSYISKNLAGILALEYTQDFRQ